MSGEQNTKSKTTITEQQEQVIANEQQEENKKNMPARIGQQEHATKNKTIRTG